MVTTVLVVAVVVAVLVGRSLTLPIVVLAIALALVAAAAVPMRLMTITFHDLIHGQKKTFNGTTNTNNVPYKNNTTVGCNNFMSVNLTMHVMKNNDRGMVERKANVGLAKRYYPLSSTH